MALQQGILSRQRASWLAAWLALLLLGASLLSAAHVHPVDEHSLGSQNQFEQCSAYHIADHQQAAADAALTIGQIVDQCYYAYHFEASSVRQLRLPPSRAPPAFS